MTAKVPQQFVINHVPPSALQPASTPGVSKNVPVPAEKTPSHPVAREPLTPTACVLPATAGTAWLLTLGIAVTQGATFPLLAGVAIAGLTSTAAMGGDLIRRRATTSVPVATAHFNYATDGSNNAERRARHAHAYVRSVKTISGEDACRLFTSLSSCNTPWKEPKRWFANRRSPLITHIIIKSIGLGNWHTASWTPCPLIQAVIEGLHKLGPVTDEQRIGIEKNALEILDLLDRSIPHTHNFDRLVWMPYPYRSDLQAAVRELVRRAPRADTPDTQMPPETASAA